MKNTEIIDPDSIALLTGVSRRTVMRAAERHGAIVYVGNKGYVLRSALRAVLGKRYDPSVAKAGAVRAERPKTLQEVANALKCSRSTVLRVVGRTGLGVQIGGRRFIPSDQIRAVRNEIMSPGVTRIHLDSERMKEHARKMAAASARVRQQAAKVRHRRVVASAG